MQKKLSLWFDNAIAATCLICLMVFAPITIFSLERKPAPVAPAAPAVDQAPPLLLPLQCDARVRQSDAGTPRMRLFYASEMPDARCYIKKSGR
jgi:hypothetical protein